MPPTLAKMGVTNVNAQIPITSFVNVFINTYCMVPLLTTVVGHWLTKPRPAFIDAQPWKLLDQGFPVIEGPTEQRRLGERMAD